MESWDVRMGSCQIYVTVGKAPQLMHVIKITNYPDADPAASPRILYAKSAPDQMGLIKASVRSGGVGVLSVL